MGCCEGSSEVVHVEALSTVPGPHETLNKLPPESLRPQLLQEKLATLSLDIFRKL